MRIKKILTVFGVSVAFALAGFGSYRPLGTSLEPNTWTCKISGVLAKAAETGYPILYIDVNSASCGHCHTLNSLTLSSIEFKALERDVVFYQVMTDDAQISTMAEPSIYSRYSKYYYNGSGYPLVAVIARDGSVYGSFDRTDTDVRNVAADLRTLIEQLSMIQLGKVLHTDGTESTTVVPGGVPTNPVPPTVKPDTPSAAKPTTLAGWKAALKGKSSGVVFDADENVKGILSLNVNAKGKVSVKLTKMDGRVAAKTEFVLDGDGNPGFSVNGIEMTYDYDSSLWIGTIEGGKAFAGKVGAKRFDGLYTLSATNADSDPGYLTLTVKNGKGRIGGQVNGRNKVSANGTGIVLPERVVEANIPRWNVGQEVALYPIVNSGKKMYGAMVVAKNGGAAGRLYAFGDNWEASGEEWSVSTSLAPLDGKSVKVGVYEIPVVVSSASKIAAGANDYAAKVQAMVKKGTFKGALKLPEGRLQFEGALIGSGDTIRGTGVSFGVDVYSVTLGDVEECGECTVKDK